MGWGEGIGGKEKHFMILPMSANLRSSKIRKSVRLWGEGQNCWGGRREVVMGKGKRGEEGHLTVMPESVRFQPSRMTILKILSQRKDVVKAVM